ncbi:unnamed protein product [Orchesella dallaii]|uniref:RING-type domain-containing protein n=1 Tax=Orchesella dallaii TaxID=48710 RepID=A0ABP1QHN0_9HEXA
MECSVCLNLLSESQGQGTDLGSGSTSRKRPGPFSKTRAAVSTVVCTPCGHLFHRACLRDWFTGSGIANVGNCPSCRRVLLPSTMYPVFFDDDEVKVERKKRKLSQEKVGASKRAKLVIFSGKSPSLISPINKSGKSVNLSCENEECQEMYQRHKILMKDFHDLQEKYYQERERADMNEAKVLSLGPGPGTTFNNDTAVGNPQNIDGASSYTDWLKEIRVLD